MRQMILLFTGTPGSSEGLEWFCIARGFARMRRVIPNE